MNLQRIRELAGIKLNESVTAVPGLTRKLREATDEDLLNAIAALYGPDIWDNDAMQDLVRDLEMQQPTDQEIQYIIDNGALPPRLANMDFTNNDDVQFGSANEAIELGDNSISDTGWFIVSDKDNQICAGPFSSETEARQNTGSMQWYNPITHFIAQGIDDDGSFVDAPPEDFEPMPVGGKHPGMVDENQYEPDVEAASVTELSAQLSAGEISYAEFKERLHDLENQHYSMQQGEMGNPDMRDDMAYNRPGGDREDWDAFDADNNDDEYDDEYDELDGEIDEVILGEEEDSVGLHNGYGDTEYANGADYFPNGADAPVTTDVGPSGAKQGDNPEQKKMQVSEVHSELVYGYRKYLKESAKK